MNQEPKIITLTGKKLVGHSIEMSLQNNKNMELFSGFMPKKNQIKNVVSNNVFEVMIYNSSYFKGFSPTNTFTKWATLEVSTYTDIPDTMDTLELSGGLYVVFKYKGLPQGFGKLMGYIMANWLPQSNYQLDNRPHFNVLGENYKRDNPESEEDVYIPIKPKS